MKILGMGNALVDIMTELDKEDYLNTFDLPKGSMTLVDAIKSERVHRDTGHLKKTIRSGGSAANTIHGLAKLGIETGFLGKIGKDRMGDIFKNDLLASKITPHLSLGVNPSGKAVALVSPDTERTFATYLGAAIELDESDLMDELFGNYDIFHIEGYIVQNHVLLDAALKKAKEHGLKISIDMASYNVVEENLEFLKEVVEKYVDIVFANEEEAKAFTGLPPLQAMHKISEVCDIAVVKIGKKGSMLKAGDEIHMIEPIAAKSIDTTGAGDLYASGFLYGLVKDLPLDKCGDIASLLAGKVIEQIGPKVAEEDWPAIRAIVRKIEQSRR
jgi:sugar/nucleoside kinase (ribokinase family)